MDIVKAFQRRIMVTSYVLPCGACQEAQDWGCAEISLQTLLDISSYLEQLLGDYGLCLAMNEHDTAYNNDISRVIVTLIRACDYRKGYVKEKMLNLIE